VHDAVYDGSGTYVVANGERNLALHQRERDEQHVGDNVVESEGDECSDARPDDDHLGDDLTRGDGEVTGVADEDVATDSAGDDVGERRGDNLCHSERRDDCRGNSMLVSSPWERELRDSQVLEAGESKIPVETPRSPAMRRDPTKLPRVTITRLDTYPQKGILRFTAAMSI
jgi:hypothetical protein